VAAAFAALFVVLGLFSSGFRVFCLVVIAAATVAAGPARATGEGGWWWLLAGGAALSILGAIVAQPSATLGGLMALIGGLLVIGAAAIGFPREPAEEE
jgi:uncharacterized membrane protein YhaH (DUF805 family)